MEGEALLADVYFHSERWSEAIPIYVRVHEGLEKNLGAGSWLTLRALTMYLYCLDLTGRQDEAVVLARTLLAQGRLYLAATDYGYRTILLVSATVLLKAGQIDEASALIDELAQIVDGLQLTDFDDPLPRQYLAYLRGMRAQKLGDVSAAVRYLTEAVKGFERVGSPNFPPASEARARLRQLQSQAKTGS